MASGFTDWDVPVNITAQQLNEVVNRPKYGAAQHADLFEFVPGLTTSTRVSITGKGVTYGGFIRASHVAEMNSNKLIITIDGQAITTHSFFQMFLRGIFHEDQRYFWLVYYDSVYFDYMVRIQRWITFESSFKIEYVNDKAFTVPVFGSLVYATV